MYLTLQMVLGSVHRDMRLAITFIEEARQLAKGLFDNVYGGIE